MHGSFPFLPRTLRAKLTLAMILIACLVVSAVVVTEFFLRRKELLEQFQASVQSIAGTTSISIPAEVIAAVRTNAEAGSPEFQQVRTVLDKSAKVNSLTEKEIYILRPIEVTPERIVTEFVVMLQPKTFVGDRYEITPANMEPFRKAWKTGVPQSTGIYKDPHGTWISGYSPILDQQGKPAAILEVDAEISRYLARQQEELFAVLGISALALLVGIIPGLLLVRQITSGLLLLTNGMTRFQSGEHKLQLNIRSKDEIGMLSETFNEMILSLSERLALLPFVSRFTANAVRRSRHDPDWLKGSEQAVVVLFADLRGFTRFSESREAQTLVEQLNQILSVEAEVVLSMGGDVDKFVGDAVMALFFDVEEPARAALACAKEMLRRVRDQVEQNNLDLALGVGIHAGPAVLGSIGAEVRRDCTAIGHTVNLASRLCDSAGRWQILISEMFLQELPETERGDFQPTEPMRFKNVSQPVATFAWALASEAGIADRK